LINFRLTLCDLCNVVSAGKPLLALLVADSSRHIGDHRAGKARSQTQTGDSIFDRPQKELSSHLDLETFCNFQARSARADWSTIFRVVDWDIRQTKAQAVRGRLCAQLAQARHGCLTRALEYQGSSSLA